MSDEYEYRNGLDPLRDDASEDPDQDGMTSGEESVAGTRANDRNSVFQFLGRPLPILDGVSLTWSSVPGKRYLVWLATRVTGPYEAVTVEVPADPDKEQTSVNVPDTGRPAYYRVQVIPEQ